MPEPRKPPTYQCVSRSPGQNRKQNPTLPEQSPDTSLHQKCAVCVPAPDGLPEDLAEVVSRWDSLPVGLKADILAKVREQGSR